MASSTVPRVRRTAQNTQFTYNLSRRVTDIQTYPVQSPQGATILLYGHDNGVTLVWRGGRRFKPAKNQPAPEQQNGSGADAVMIIDSDDEAPPSKSQSTSKFEDKPQFEDAVESTPYPETQQTLDLALGTAVQNIAVVPMAPCAAGDAPSALSQKIVFAVSCITHDVYLITLPLTPPSPESKARPELRSDLLAGRAGSGAWGETLVHLSGQLRRADGLAINARTPKSSKGSRFVVAAHSREASGVLRLWDVSPDSKDAVEPFQTEYLPHPLTSIAFNPVRTTHLLAVSSVQGARIYDFARPSLPPESGATGVLPTQGSWLLTLYQPFAKASSARRPILDAAWIAHGRAIFVLLADGMWGIWDIDGASPTAPGANITTKLKPGVQGAALTVFSVSGYIEGTGSLRSTAVHGKDMPSGELKPMTPHTRRQATATFTSTVTPDRLATVQGGVTVLPLPSTGKALQDESVVLWVGSLEHVCVIPGVMRFWDSQLRKGGGGGVNLFSGANPTRMLKLLDLSTGLLGERCCGATLVLATKTADDTSQDGLPVEVVVRGESRMVIVREGDDTPGKRIGGVVGTRRNRLFSNEKSTAIIVHGANRQASRSFNLSTAKPGSLRQRPLFPQDDTDDDVDMTRENSTTRHGFFGTLSAAADATDDFSRDLEAEMLDVMEIDRALDTMQDGRGVGRKKVLFDGH